MPKIQIKRKQNQTQQTLSNEECLRLIAENYTNKELNALVKLIHKPAMRKAALNFIENNY